MEEDMPSPENSTQNPEAFHELKNPDFNSGNILAYFSPDPRGLVIETDQSLRRKDGPLNLSPEEKKSLVEGMGDEMKFTGGQEAKAELDKARAGGDWDNVKKKFSQGEAVEYEEKRKDYVYKGNKQKVGIRNVRKDGRRLIVDTKPVSFPVYKNFAKPDLRPERRDFGQVGSTSMIIITTDNKILIQHRSEKNELYGDMPGASVAGLLDGELERSTSGKRGTLVKITEDSALANVKNESVEELGIEGSDYSRITLVGLCETIKPTVGHEFLFQARTKLSSDQIRQKSLNTARARKNSLKAEDIEDKFTFIDATPEAIFTLLTEVKCPLPPSHIASFAATAYNLMLERDDKDKADEFKKKLEQGVMTNYEAIDRTVKEFYLSNPNELSKTPERFKDKKAPVKNPAAYSPEYYPQEQGLPDFESGINSIGLTTAT